MNSTLLKIKNLEGQFFTHTKSQAGQWLNYKLIHVDDGHVEVSVEVRNEMTNPNGMLHGGMIGMICDELCGLAFYTKGISTFYTTVNLSIDFLYSAHCNSVITGKARVIRCGKKIANTECSLFDEHGTMIAHATSNLVNTEKQVFDLHLPFQN